MCVCACVYQDYDIPKNELEWIEGKHADTALEVQSSTHLKTAPKFENDEGADNVVQNESGHKPCEEIIDNNAATTKSMKLGTECATGLRRE